DTEGRIPDKPPAPFSRTRAARCSLLLHRPRRRASPDSPERSCRVSSAPVFGARSREQAVRWTRLPHGKRRTCIPLLSFHALPRLLACPGQCPACCRTGGGGRGERSAP